ncbi:hypothetical protein E2C01_006912 [Portunus trituberculatus]|uniref:Uncharacterized protein n=1 Tax=Portunus trituberculatus TaxID=210409 RepID=A0A5B7CYL1_PORTR|nr:hypothetical protein [Portunus trituberculatus]
MMICTNFFILYNSFFGSQMCSFSLTNFKIFCLHPHHIFKPISVTSKRKQNRKSTE